MRRIDVNDLALDVITNAPTRSTPALDDTTLPSIQGRLHSSKVGTSDDAPSIDLGCARHYKRNAVIALAVFVAAVGLVKRPGLVDIPVVKLLNSYANRVPFWDALFHDFDTYFTFSGVILIALIWSCWFSKASVQIRARILVAIVASVGAGIVSRFLQHHVRSHIRPYYHPAIHFHPPAMPAMPFNTWNCFPSDHAAVFSGLAIAIYLARPRLGMFAAAWLVVIECSRIYMGAHYPSDLVGGAALAAVSVWASQAPSLIAVGRRVAGWERSSPALFYMSAFFITYQIATLFLDVRLAASDFSSITHLK